jgi:hypothetical protein
MDQSLSEIKQNWRCYRQHYSHEELIRSVLTRDLIATRLRAENARLREALQVVLSEIGELPYLASDWTWTPDAAVDFITETIHCALRGQKECDDNAQD